MPITVSRTGELNLTMPQITQEQRDALWAAFVTSWLDKNQEQFAQMISQPETQSA